MDGQGARFRIWSEASNVSRPGFSPSGRNLGMDGCGALKQAEPRLLWYCLKKSWSVQLTQAPEVVSVKRSPSFQSWSTYITFLPTYVTTRLPWSNKHQERRKPRCIHYQLDRNMVAVRGSASLPKDNVLVSRGPSWDEGRQTLLSLSLLLLPEALSHTTLCLNATGFYVPLDLVTKKKCPLARIRYLRFLSELESFQVQ